MAPPARESVVGRCCLVAVFWLSLLFALPAVARFAVPFQFAPIGPSTFGTWSPVHGAVRLSATAPDGRPLHGLSGLAWSTQGRVLYAVSDFGYLVVLRPVFDGVALVDVEFVARIPLRDPAGRSLRGRQRDAEGLALQRMPDGRESLLVSFEQVPRVVRFAPDGSFIESLTLPARLSERLQKSAPNRGLEGLAWNGRHGVLTSLEGAPAHAPGSVEIHSLRGARYWTCPVAETGGALVSLESVADDQLVLLERRYVSPLVPLIITVRHLDLEAAGCAPRTLARFSSADGWPVDNFEAIALHHGTYYFMLSDDNANPLQSTLLVYLALARTRTAAAISRADAASVRRGCRDACDNRADDR